MTDMFTTASNPGWTAARSRPRRLAPGIGLAFGAVVSLALWAGLALLVAKLI